MDTADDRFQPLIIPRDCNGYVMSFDISSSNDLMLSNACTFFEKYGFVVFANVFSPEQCTLTIADIWDIIECFVGKSVRHDESLWTNEYAALDTKCVNCLCFL
jgi:hypothetical protein